MLPTENVSNENVTDRQASHENEHLDAAFINFLKSLRYEDENTGKPKRKSKLKVPAGQRIAVEDFGETESSDQDESEGEGIETDSDSIDENGAMDVEQTVVKQETYPFPKRSEEIHIEDWLLVKFFYLSKKPGTLTMIINFCIFLV